MANFGERLASWYLRFNGFFLVENFVLHGNGGGPRSADADILGIRLRHSVASIGEAQLKCDDLLAQKLGGLDRHLALVVQVKTGRTTDPGCAFERYRLERCLQFIGLADSAGCDELLRRLTEAPMVDVEADWRVAKVLVAERAPDSQGHVVLDLDEVFSFIENRLQEFRVRKSADRLFFGDELIQFLAWRAGGGGAAKHG